MVLNPHIKIVEQKASINMHTLKVVIGQLNFLVGDVLGNAKLMLEKATYAKEMLNADMIVFSELALTSYPPEDLLFRDDLYQQIHQALNMINQSMPDIAIVLGLPEKKDHRLYNQAICLYQGQTLATYTKQELPNYKVFDEKRYFTPENKTTVFEFKNFNIGLLICEDVWYPEPIQAAKKSGADVIITINASPFNIRQAQTRENLLSVHAHHNHLPILYVNLVGGQDELVFDGGSFAINADATIAAQAPYFKESLLPIVLEKSKLKKVSIVNQWSPEAPTTHEKIYQALVLGLRDYVHKNGFKGVLLGLSGGIDSALACAIAVDALGPQNVLAVLLPSQYTADISIDDAIAEANALEIQYKTLSIQPMYESILKTLEPILQHEQPTTVEENIQARCRGILLMALSNETGLMTLTTSNKSEIAVGYTTLYGDMCGGLAILKDVSKTLLYELARYRNDISPVIPERVLKRAPSAELRENQTDEDSLPPYEILDQIIERYVEQDQSINDICKAGFDHQMVSRIVKLIHQNEYKRRQSAPGIRITQRAFGKDRRYPITAGWIHEK
jgi:NAD+ synthase (glutamine-hydrolysing)